MKGAEMCQASALICNVQLPEAAAALLGLFAMSKAHLVGFAGVVEDALRARSLPGIDVCADTNVPVFVKRHDALPCIHAVSLDDVVKLYLFFQSKAKRKESVQSCHAAILRRASCPTVTSWQVFLAIRSSRAGGMERASSDGMVADVLTCAGVCKNCSAHD
jgi:hypothetical protein